MAIYEIRTDQIRQIQTATFAELGVKERQDLQRLLRARIGIVAPDCLVIAEEFGEWDDSRRRIDLLAIDTDANLVIIELKRTDTGGHMELQALRYAAMISTMTGEQAVEAFRRYLRSNGDDPDSAEEQILDHLGWDEIDEEQFATDIRIVLVSAEFSKELTTAVIWLIDRGVDIRCVRLRPMRDGDRALVDVQQIIPLPEAAEYQVRVREKHERERSSSRGRGRDYTRFNVFVGDKLFEHLPKRRAMLAMVKGLTRAGVKPEQIQDLITWRGKQLFYSQPGQRDVEAMQAAMIEARQRGDFSRAPKRFFCWDDEDVIHQNGQTYVFSNQWGRRTEEAMTILTKAFPDAGVRFQRSDAE